MSNHPQTGGLGPAIALLRPRQWIKNLFCFTPVIFAGKATLPLASARAAVACVAFCAASSAVYALNDLADRARDARHPVKRLRPLASGALSPRAGAMVAVVCAGLGLGLALGLGWSVLGIVAAYLALQAAYSGGLKRIVILDVMLIAAGFLLRIFAGGEAVPVPVSAWILLCTFFLALFLGFAKRRAELDSGTGGEGGSREVLGDYTGPMLDSLCAICAALAIATYALFTTSSGRDHTLVITCPPVVFALFRYFYLTQRQRGGENAEALLLADRPIQAAIALWIGLYAWVLYGGLRLNIQ